MDQYKSRRKFYFHSHSSNKNRMCILIVAFCERKQRFIKKRQFLQQMSNKQDYNQMYGVMNRNAGID